MNSFYSHVTELYIHESEPLYFCAAVKLKTVSLLLVITSASLQGGRVRKNKIRLFIDVYDVYNTSQEGKRLVNYS